MKKDGRWDGGKRERRMTRRDRGGWKKRREVNKKNARSGERGKLKGEENGKQRRKTEETDMGKY